MSLYDGSTFEHEGFTFKVFFPDDEENERPWENDEGRGPVREVEFSRETGYIAKKPGERILNRNPDRRSYVWAYDWAEAMRIAKRDGWNTKPYDAPNRVERAVKADFDFLAGWVNGDWRYIGVKVCLMVEDDDGDGDLVEYDGDEFDATDSLWGVESCGDYKEEVAHELAAEILSRFKVCLRDNLMAEMEQAREALAVREWAERDVMTC